MTDCGICRAAHRGTIREFYLSCFQLTLYFHITLCIQCCYGCYSSHTPGPSFSYRISHVHLYTIIRDWTILILCRIAHVDFIVIATIPESEAVSISWSYFVIRLLSQQIVAKEKCEYNNDICYVYFFHD